MDWFVNSLIDAKVRLTFGGIEGDPLSYYLSKTLLEARFTVVGASSLLELLAWLVSGLFDGGEYLVFVNQSESAGYFAFYKLLMSLLSAIYVSDLVCLEGDRSAPFFLRVN